MYYLRFLRQTRNYLLLVLVVTASYGKVQAQSPEEGKRKFTYKGFSGGMMLHSGYTWGNSFSVMNAAGEWTSLKASGAVFGIGGRAAVSFGEHWRFGMEGYVSTTHYGEKRQFRLGWGGIFAEYQFHCGRFHPFVGLSVGGGGVNNTFTLETPSNDFVSKEMVWRKYGIFILNPYIGTEFTIKNNFRLFIKADYLLAPFAMLHEPDFTTGIRIFFGVVFCRQPK